MSKANLGGLLATFSEKEEGALTDEGVLIRSMLPVKSNVCNICIFLSNKWISIILSVKTSGNQ